MIQKQQEGIDIGSLEERKATEDVDTLVDKNMIALLKACSAIKRPTQDEID